MTADHYPQKKEHIKKVIKMIETDARDLAAKINAQSLGDDEKKILRKKAIAIIK